MTKTLEQLKCGDVLIYYSNDTKLLALFISCEVKIVYSWNMVSQYCFVFSWLNCCGFVKNFTFLSPDKNYMLFTSSKNKNIILQKQNIFFLSGRLTNENCTGFKTRKLYHFELHQV